ncbi:addiction module antidote protein, HigA family [Carboxydocella sporoproducens DSM 16521]|uniref:Addiction module antidote protein, HigA family n=2 Tax=Carboxydocella TaxID=178898 RepID=A0A1T4QBR8_9FIRM|nr:MULTISPECIES: HigA family addiction module antitoxin [Carboxydocella]AVX21644.1 addiction module antidote protein, HigA family [Carboxydocella thermautotrophica]SKA01233.1 addiction module antidote protein, HigA family [Carboxydocella sporoproducens DSM 16521]
MTNKYYEFTPDYAVPPGATILELLEHLNITQAQLAERTGRPKKTINEIIKGKTAITPETALQFEKVLGISANYLLRLEANYQETLARIKEKKSLEQNIEWLKNFPIKEMIKNKWIRECKDKVEQLDELLKFFGVSSVDAWDSIWRKYQVLFRKSNIAKTNPYAIASWLRRGEIEANNIDCLPYNKDKFKEVLFDIKNLTTTSPEVFVPQMQMLCAKAGVAVVFVKEFKGVPVSGATKWLSSEKALIQLSLRYKYNDHLWFSFYHEAGHILLHDKKSLFLETNETSETNKEKEADRFAANFLIPQRDYIEFIKKFDSRNISRNAVISFANKLRIAPGIVVGRLQHDRLIPYSYLNDLKVKYCWTDEK